MKLVHEIQSPQPRAVGIVPGDPIAPATPPLLGGRGGGRGERPLGPLVLDEAVPHPLLHPVDGGLGILLGLAAVVVPDLHWLGGAGGGGEGVLGGGGGGSGRGVGRREEQVVVGGGGKEGGEEEVGLVEEGVDVEEVGGVGGGGELLGHEGGLF